MKKRNQKEEKLSEVVDKYISNVGLKNRFLQQEVISIFNKKMGPFLLKKVSTVYVKDKKLFLKLTSAPFKEEIRMQKTKLISQINFDLDKDYLVDVVLL